MRTVSRACIRGEEGNGWNGEKCGGISLVGLTSAELVNVPIPSVIAVDVEKVILAKTAKDSCLVFIDILMIFFFFLKENR